MDNLELLKSISFDIGILAISTLATFFIPGISGIIISGIIQITGQTLGIQINGGNLPSDPIWWVTNFLAVFGPYFKEIAVAKMDFALLGSAEKGIQSVNRVLEKIDNASKEAIEWLKTSPGEKVLASGLSRNAEKEVADVEKQELAREKFGSENTKVVKKIDSFRPNTKNPLSWIAGVGFRETLRLGPRDIRGDLIIKYYVNNHHRVGFKKIPIAEIVLGRTSGGERTGGAGGQNTSNASRYRHVDVAKDPSKVKMVTVVFKGARYYNDYLAFLKSHSWGGYYMRRWMVGQPGRKPAAEAINGLILFGSIWRVKSKLAAITGHYKDLAINREKFFNDEARKLFGTTRLGSRYNKAKGVFTKMNSATSDSANFFKSQIKEQGSKVRNKSRANSLKKER